LADETRTPRGAIKLHPGVLECSMKHWKKWEIKKIELADKQYPKLLKKIRNSPKQLYFRGRWNKKIFSDCLAVVGARKITRYGESVIENLIPDLVRVGLTIVSGFMYGVDGKAHKVCLQNKGKTIAVLGCGLDILYPVLNDKLYTEILENDGLVMSEYERKVKPELWTFPQRNRIVAGLSKGVLVIEGGEKSGSLITARIGFQQKKPVMAVPGAINSSMSAGTNWLIRNGAIAVTKAEEILEELEIIAPRRITPRGGIKDSAPGRLSKEEEKIVDELEREELDVDELARKLKMKVDEMGALLSLMSLKQLVKEKNGKYRLG